jgi:hypothetical protein
MEIPYNGRAIVEDNFDSVTINIPIKRNYFITIFLCFWLCGWFVGESFALSSLFGLGNNAPQLFLLVWVCGWTLGGIFVIKTVLWQIAGKEIIEVGKGVLIIKKKGDWFKKARTYDLNECKAFRVKEDALFNTFGMLGGRRPFGGNTPSGTINFDYGMKTIKFGEGVEEAEAKYLLGILKSKGLLVDKNFE